MRRALKRRGRLTDSERADAWSEIEQELAKFETDEGFAGPCELIVAAGTARAT